VHILRTPKGGRGGSRETLRWDSGGRGVKAWVRSIFIIAFGDFNGSTGEGGSKSGLKQGT